MPYDNPYNRKIAKEVEGLNKSYIKNIGTYYPLEGGSLDTGYDSERIVGGAMEEYVRNVLSGSLNVPTQAMPSSSMSGMGMSAGMRKYKKGMGFTGGYKKGTKLTQEQKDALRTKRLAPSAMADLEKLVMKQDELFNKEYDKGARKIERQMKKEQRMKKFDEAYDKGARKIERQMKREERGYVAKPRKTNSWVSFIQMKVKETGRKYNELIKDPSIKLEYSKMKGSGMSGGWKYKGQKLGLARSIGVNKKDYGKPYKNRGQGIPEQLLDWHEHLQDVREENPDMPFKSALVIAKDTYRR